MNGYFRSVVEVDGGHHGHNELDEEEEVLVLSDRFASVLHHGKHPLHCGSVHARVDADTVVTVQMKGMGIDRDGFQHVILVHILHHLACCQIETVLGC